jgi:arylsulfatase A-like enzyme
MHKRIISILQGSLVMIFMFMSTGCAALFAEDTRPNFLVIMTDDQRYDTMQYMPKTLELIFDQGVTFSHAYITTPLCCPSRSSIFTGMYASNHGVLDNTYELDKKTVIEVLHEDGYTTGLVGKYLNTWNGEPRPEFDYWVSFQYGETRYNNPRLNVNGEWSRHENEYITYALGRYAMEFIDEAAPRRKPFILMWTVNAPHDPAVPATEDKYLPLELPPRLPSFNEADMSDKPAWMADEEKTPLLGESEIQEIDAFRRNQILTLYSLDRTLEQVINKLSETGELDNTVIIFLSDNGRHWGEHRQMAKNTVYEETTHVPFAIRYPPLVSQPYIENGVIANIDIAPTIYELAGIPIPPEVDGKSLVGLLTQTGDWREGVLLEGWPPRGTYLAIRTDRYIYAETTNDGYAPEGTVQMELYDLEVDPYQMENVANNPEYQDILAHLQTLLHAEKSKSEATP